MLRYSLLTAGLLLGASALPPRQAIFPDAACEG